MMRLLLLLLATVAPTALGGGAVSVVLNGQAVSVEYLVEWSTQTVLFTVRCPSLSSNKWLLLGFSDHGEYNVSDYCQFDVDEGTLWDGFIDSRFSLRRDRQQDCALLQADATSFSFRRRFLTCDPKDYAIEIGTAQLFLARSSSRTSNFSSPLVYADFAFSQLLKEEKRNPSAKNPPGAIQMHVAANQAKVPSVVTTYWCVVQKLPTFVSKQKFHVTWLWSNITRGNEHLVHHLMLFHCPTGEQQEFDGDCNDPRKPKAAAACSKVIGAISMGEGPIEYPPEAGLPFGGATFNPYVMIEIHYNNVAKTAGIRDSSGFDLVLTPQLRPNDAGIIEFGVIYGDALSIPPHQKRFAMSGYCTADCTNYFPEDGINVFISQMHGHLVARKLWSSLYRDGVKITEINRDDHYSPHWQHVNTLNPTVHIKRGDVIATTCIYDTTKHAKVVRGGYGIEDEMCISYNYYWPASEIEMCKSAVNNETLHRFFASKGVKNGQLTIAEKYDSVEWNEENVRDLSEMFAVAPLNQHCYRFDGSTYPGHPTNWSKIEHPHLTFGAYDKGRARYECQALND